MFDEVLERNEVRNLLREIVNNPKYYDKGIEEVLKKDYFLQGRIFFLFYEALYYLYHQLFLIEFQNY